MKKLVLSGNKIRAAAAAALIAALVLGTSGCGTADTGDDAQTEAVSENETGEQTAASGSGEEITIRVGDFNFAYWNSEFVVAYENGIFDDVFAKDNVSIEIIPFSNGPAANEAFLAGELDIVNGIGDQPIVIGIGNDINTSIVAGAAKQGENIGILATPESGVSSAEDLKGKRIGVYVGTYVHKSLIGILEDAGISEDEVEIVNISSTSDADAAFESGDIDAYLAMNGAYIKNRIADGYVLVSDCSEHPAYSYIVASNDFTEDYPEITRKFMEALYEAEQWIDENPEETYEVLAGYYETDAETIKDTIEGADISILWDDQYEGNLTETYDFLLSHDMISVVLEEDDISNHINLTFLDGLDVD